MSASPPGEFLLVAACCIWPHSTLREERIAAALSSGIRWDRLLSTSARHRVDALVRDGLERSAGSAVPGFVREKLRMATIAQTAATIRQAHETARLVELLAQAHIPAVVLKGVTLAVLAFGDLTHRSSHDIDLLVRPEDTDRAAELLESLGYRRHTPGEHWRGRDLERWKRHLKDYAYRHTQTGQVLELHWRLTHNAYIGPQTFGLTALLQVSLPVDLTLPGLEMDVLLLYLCAHGALHGWFRLKWLADVAALLRSKPGTLERLLRDAPGCGLRIAAEQTLLLCEKFLALPLPASVRPGLRARLLAASAERALFSSAAVRLESAGGLLRHGLSLFLLSSNPRYLWETMLHEGMVRGEFPSPLPVWMQGPAHFAQWAWQRSTGMGSAARGSLPPV